MNGFLVKAYAQRGSNLYDLGHTSSLIAFWEWPIKRKKCKYLFMEFWIGACLNISKWKEIHVSIFTVSKFVSNTFGTLACVSYFYIKLVSNNFLLYTNSQTFQ